MARHQSTNEVAASDPPATALKPRLLDQVRQSIRTRQYSYQIEKAYKSVFGEYRLPRFIAMWFVAMMAMRILLVWIYSNTGSLLLAQLTHASSTGFLVIFGPEAISPAQGTLWFAVYAAVLWIPAAVVIARYGRGLVRQPRQTKAI